MDTVNDLIYEAYGTLEYQELEAIDEAIRAEEAKKQSLIYYFQ